MWGSGTRAAGDGAVTDAGAATGCWLTVCVGGGAVTDAGAAPRYWLTVRVDAGPEVLVTAVCEILVSTTDTFVITYC